MISYVDRWLQHWAQEMRVPTEGVSLGFRSAWPGGAVGIGSETGRGRVTARGTASRSGAKRTGLGPFAERINQEIERLPPRQQEVLRAYYLVHSSLTVAQKAEDLGCSQKTMYKHIHKAQAALAAALPDGYVDTALFHPQGE